MALVMAAMMFYRRLTYSVSNGTDARKSEYHGSMDVCFDIFSLESSATNYHLMVPILTGIRKIVIS